MNTKFDKEKLDSTAVSHTLFSEQPARRGYFLAPDAEPLASRDR